MIYQIQLLSDYILLTYHEIVFVFLAPTIPMIDVPKCSRSPNSVVIVLNPPTLEYDVIDGYKVYYCSEEQKARGEQVKLTHISVLF